jgi:hypothetical protein
MEELFSVLREATARAGALRRQSDEVLLAEQRTRLVEALEREHPGITEVSAPWPGGAYRVDPERVHRALAAAASPVLAELLRGESASPP